MRIHPGSDIVEQFRDVLHLIQYDRSFEAVQKRAGIAAHPVDDVGVLQQVVFRFWKKLLKERCLAGAPGAGNEQAGKQACGFHHFRLDVSMDKWHVSIINYYFINLKFWKAGLLNPNGILESGP